jgi:hypothetical protein
MQRTKSSKALGLIGNRESKPVRTTVHSSDPTARIWKDGALESYKKRVFHKGGIGVIDAYK